MSKQQQAPGDLEQVRSFVNTLDLDLGEDSLADPATLAQWLQDTGLGGGDVSPTGGDVGRALELREALRTMLLAHNDRGEVPDSAAQVLDHAAQRARVQLRFPAGSGGSTLEPQAGGVDGALGRLMAIVHESIERGTWERLKACREHTCEWAFYDHTKNRSGTWCNMGVCGNRAKARAYRERRAGSSSGPSGAAPTAAS